MRGFKITCSNNGWYFELIPSNNNQQPIGASFTYASEKECLQAIKNFRNIIKTNKIKNESSNFVEIYKTEKTPQYYAEYKSNNIPIFKTRIYIGTSAKTNAQKCIVSIYNNIDDYTSNKL